MQNLFITTFSVTTLFVVACKDKDFILNEQENRGFYYSFAINKGMKCHSYTEALTGTCRRRKRHEFDPWVGKIPWRRKWHPLQYSRWENPMDRGAWWAVVHRVAEWLRAGSRGEAPAEWWCFDSEQRQWLGSFVCVPVAPALHTVTGWFYEMWVSEWGTKGGTEVTHTRFLGAESCSHFISTSEALIKCKCAVAKAGDRRGSVLCFCFPVVLMF